MTDTRPVVVVGGGIAGLTAAFRLHQGGAPFVLCEAAERLGGVICSESADGFLMEAGPDAILAQKREGLELCRELGLGPRLMPTNPAHRTVYIVRRGRLHAMPDGLVLTIPTRILPFARSGLFSWPAKLRMGLDLVIPRRRETSDESIASFLRRRFGREALELLGEPLLAGIHSGDPERLSMRATFARFVEMEERYGSLIRGMLASRPPKPKAAHGKPHAAFYSLLGGLSELVGALEERLPRASVQLGRRVTSLERVDDGYRLGLDGAPPLSTPAVVLATPARASAPLLAGLAPAIASALAAVPFVSTAVVFLGFRRQQVRHPLDGYGLLAPRSEGVRTAAMSFFSTKYPGRAPEGHVLLRGFLGGAQDNDILSLSDDELRAAAHRDFSALLGIEGEPVLSRVYRWPAGTPQMEVGHLERVAAIERQLPAHPGLFLTGAGLRTTGIPDGVADATRVARDVAAYLGRT